MSVPNFSYLAGLEVAEKFVWGGMFCTVIFVSNPTVVLCCVGVGVGVWTILSNCVMNYLFVFSKEKKNIIDFALII